MRFLQFLREDKQTERALAQVERQCADFIQELGAQFGLWRGFNRRFSLPDDHKLAVPEDRKPLDTEREIHHAMDDWFFDNFGFRARSNAVFCTGSENAALAYGNVHAIYPIGKYEYVWSPEVEDTLHLNEEARQLLMRIEGRERRKLSVAEWRERKAEIIIDILEKSRYTGSGLKQAVKSHHEIMLHCDHYYAFSKLDPVWQEWSGYKDKFRDTK